eukprot:1773325-Rhodomonas_salina.1
MSELSSQGNQSLRLGSRPTVSAIHALQPQTRQQVTAASGAARRAQPASDSDSDSERGRKAVRGGPRQRRPVSHPGWVAAAR